MTTIVMYIRPPATSKDSNSTGSEIVGFIKMNIQHRTDSASDAADNIKPREKGIEIVISS